jgi:hypothetical protein
MATGRLSGAVKLNIEGLAPHAPRQNVLKKISLHRIISPVIFIMTIPIGAVSKAALYKPDVNPRGMRKHDGVWPRLDDDEDVERAL